jgi:ribokinase
MMGRKRVGRRNHAKTSGAVGRCEDVHVGADGQARGEARVEVAVVGTVNLDSTIQVTRLPVPGETVLGGDVTNAPGGKAANQAVAAARQGARTALIGCVGDDAAATDLLDFLGGEPGLDVQGVTRAPGAATGRALITIDGNGGNTIASGPGANRLLDETLVHRWGRLIGEANVLLVQLGVPIDAVRAALEIARSVGTMTILDPAPADDMPDDLFRLVDVITPNESEAARLTGLRVDTEGAPRPAAQSLIARGCSSVVITRAGRGAYYAASTDADGFDIAPYAIASEELVDVTGAGDAFNGALAAALARGENVERALRIAAVAGALAACAPGAASSMPYATATNAYVQRAT